MAFLRECLNQVRAARRDWAPEEMDWFQQTCIIGDRQPIRWIVAGVRDLRMAPARRHGRSVAVHGATRGRLAGELA